MAEDIVGEIICRKRGDTAPDKITVLDPESTTNPKAPLDITGFSYVLTVNTERDPDGVVGTEIALIAGVVTSGPAGTVEFPWTDPLADQTPEVYWYDYQQTDAAGKTKTIAKNQYIFFQDIGKS